ncbi:MAG: penicillin-binding protein 2 [Propionibacteriales bacterium]|nr:penicillin-binding protein 2 [Propionibacteriales bacterium]
MDESRRRLVVVQVLVVSLFLTLFARLWYVQVVGGDDYQAQAAENAVREVITPAERGMIVDAQGRPLVASRPSWVVTVDRDVTDEMPAAARRRVLQRVALTVGMSYEEVEARSLRCGEDGAARPPMCWNGSPYQPVPVAEDVSQQVAVSIQEQGEDFPGVEVEKWQVRAYPRPMGVNAAHLLGYLSPITEAELTEAESTGEETLNRTSQVGRAGVERTYDWWLRGVPGVQRKAVDSMGGVLDTVSVQRPRPGNTLVTSIDARVQSVVERQLRQTILTARRTVDEVTGRRFVADSGAAVVMDANDGRVVAMASYPRYDPATWVGGITSPELARLYSERAGAPLLSRAMQGQLAPGSTFKPIVASAALTHGYTPDSKLNCSNSLAVGGLDFQNYESTAYGYIDIARALQVSCNTVFYRIGYGYWLRSGADSGDVEAADPVVDMAAAYGLGRKTGIDIPGEASGRIADRRWKRAYWESQKDTYCKLGREEGDDYRHRLAREFCADGWRYRAGDAVNFAIGQGDTLVTPLQLATVYAALSNGGTLWEPRVGKAVVSPGGEVVKRIRPERSGRVPVPRRVVDYIDRALAGTTRVGTTAWRFGGFPLDDVPIRTKTGSAEVYGKQSTSWLASYDDRYVVVMMVRQGGTGSGTSGPAVRRIWESLYGVQKGAVHPDRAAQPGARPPARLPVFRPDGSIEPPVTPERNGSR